MAKRTKSYQVMLLESLRDPDEAAAYLNAALEDDSEDAAELFLLALRNVVACLIRVPIYTGDYLWLCEIHYQQSRPKIPEKIP